MEDRTKLMVEEVYGVPSGLDAATKRKIGTETLNAIGNWFNNTAYGKRFKAGQERQAALEQTLKDQGGPMALYLKLKSQPNQLEQQILEGISNLPNLIGQPGIDRRISDPLTYLALSGGLRGTARGIRNVASNPRAMQGLKNINPLAPASQKVVNVKAQAIHGKPIPAETSASVLKKGNNFLTVQVKSSQSDKPVWALQTNNKVKYKDVCTHMAFVYLKEDKDSGVWMIPTEKLPNTTSMSHITFKKIVKGYEIELQI